MKPESPPLNILRTRGVRFSLRSSGRLSIVKPWGGRLSQTSKSSGARRFFPITFSVSSKLGTDAGDACLSGDLALKTVGWARGTSGVFALVMVVPTKAARLVGAGVDLERIDCSGLGGGATEEAACKDGCSGSLA